MEDLKLTEWLLQNCTPVLKNVNNVIDFYWVLNYYAEIYSSNINDNRLKIHTSSEIIEYYNNVIH